MTRAIVFETPGLLDLRSLTMMGVSAKPRSTNPIGSFGTGMKYAVAALMRLGTPPTIYVGRNRYDFVKIEGEFRDVPVEMIELIGPYDRRELPYTTGYGARWEPWMVYRELESNTIDEGGKTYFVEGDTTWDGFRDCTRIVVDSEALIECHEKRDEVFLPDATRVAGSILDDEKVEVFAAPSRYLYWRGLRVYTLPKPARRTYNLLVPLDLTEDRTLKDPWSASYWIAQHVQQSEDTALVLDVLYATKDDYESDLPYSDSYEPSQAVVEAVSSATTSSCGAAASTALGRRVGEHLLRAAPRTDPFACWPRPWRALSPDLIIDANDNAVPLDDADLIDLVVATVNHGAERVRERLI